MRSLGGLEEGGGSFEVMGPCAFVGATVLTFLHEDCPAGFFSAANSASPTFVPSKAKQLVRRQTKNEIDEIYLLFLPPAPFLAGALEAGVGADFGAGFFAAAWFPMAGQLSGTTVRVNSYHFRLKIRRCDIRVGGAVGSGVPGAVLGPELDSVAAIAPGVNPPAE